VTDRAANHDLLNQLVAIANARFDGHLTVLKFTTNWRGLRDSGGAGRHPKTADRQVTGRRRPCCAA
jgi:hypothetical protein